MKIDENISIGDLISKWPETMELFQKYNMGCQECMSAEYETLKQGLEAHGINFNQFIQELEEYIKE
jgi:hybrid cluster-associated redox disulfide protein